MKETTINWRKYLLEIIDGKYSLDIQKIGDSASFLKNQIEASQFPNSEYDNFLDSLRKLIDETSFTAKQIVNDVSKYIFLIDWGNRFIYDYNSYLKKLIALQFSFEKYNMSVLTKETMNQTELLLIKSSFGIVEYIENWIKHNRMFIQENILDKVEYLDAIKSLWEIKISQTNELKDINIIKGLNYLNVWKNIEQAKRKTFLLTNKNNKLLLSAILFELKRTEKDKNINYYPFVEDIKLYHKDFSVVIDMNCPSWLFNENKENDENIKAPTKSKQVKETAKDMYMYKLIVSLDESLDLDIRKN